MFYKVILYFFLFFFTTNLVFSKPNVYIYANINEEIITNIDIEKEIKYLQFLNENMSQLDREKIFDVAKNSLINEIIKKKEIQKFINIDNENTFVDNYLKNIYSKLDYSNEDDFKKAVIEQESYSYEEIRKKINIELFWNELIYNKYKNQININETDLQKKIENFANKVQKEYLISEIIFEKKKNQDLNTLIDQIELSIEEIGFENSANIYSISDSSKLGGNIGWISENSLSAIISEKLSKLKEGEHTKIIQIANNFLILKVNKIKTKEKIIDKKIELQKLIKIETNKQLNQFSRIYFNKSKLNYFINEK